MQGPRLPAEKVQPFSIRGRPRKKGSLTMANVVDTLRVALADTFVMYSHAHIAHWNITGPDFHDKHEFLSDIYEDLFDAVDGIAERIRSHGQLVAGSIGAIIDPTTLMDAPQDRKSTRLNSSHT